MVAKPLIALLLALAGSFTAKAQIEFSGRYDQSFDTLLKTGRKILPGTGTVGVQSDIPSLDGWQLTRIGGTGAGLPIVLIPGEGELGEGRLYSFGHAGDNNRSLGALSTNGASMAFGVALVNKTGRALQKVIIKFAGEVWRGSSRAQDVFSFSYGFSSSSLKNDNFLTSPEMQGFAELDLRAPVVGSNTPTDGKSEKNRIENSAVLKNLNWLPNQTLFLSWRAEDAPGHGAGLGIDDFSLQAE